ncbi:MAG: DUF58 domain-containing protein [Clostridia bacterium]|nr:DUF58 domain-containing protein [Clostridia bacterium]
MTAELFFNIATTLINVIFILAVTALVGFGIFMLGRALRRFTVDRLVYGRRFSEECVYEGDTAELVETLWNPTVLPVFLVDVESYFYEGLQIGGYEAARGEMRYFVSRYHLMPFEKVTRRIEVKCIRRGYYKLTTASIFRGGDDRCIESEAVLYVYPRVDALRENMESVYGLGDALSRNRLIYDPFSVSGIREYRQGDPFHTINFKASARLVSGGHPRFAVNRYDYCASNRYYIYQNFHLPKGRELLFDAYEQLVEDGLRISASLVVKAIDSGGVCAFAANCGTVDGRRQIGFPLLGGELHKQDILKEMSLTRAMDGVSFASILAADVKRGVTGSEIFIVTPYVDGLVSEQIALFEYLGNTVKVITLKEGLS